MIPRDDGPGVRLVVNEMPYTGRWRRADSAQDWRRTRRRPRRSAFPPVRRARNRSCWRTSWLTAGSAICASRQSRRIRPPPVWRAHGHGLGWPLAVRVEMAPLEPDPGHGCSPSRVTAPMHLHLSPAIPYGDLIRSCAASAQARQRLAGRAVALGAALAAIALFARHHGARRDRARLHRSRWPAQLLPGGGRHRAGVAGAAVVGHDSPTSARSRTLRPPSTTPSPPATAHVEFLPEAGKLNVNTATPEVILPACCWPWEWSRAGARDRHRHRRLAPAGTPGGSSIRIICPWLRLFGPSTRLFKRSRNCLHVKGVTPEIFYGTYVPGAGRRARRAPRLVPRPGLVDCLSVFGSKDRVDVNTAQPAVLAAVGRSSGRHRADRANGGADALHAEKTLGDLLR